MAKYEPWKKRGQKIEDVVGERKTVDPSEAMAALQGIRERMGGYLQKGDAVKVGTYVPNKKANEKHEEGDIWEERGKLWTIKGGIKQTVTKFDGVRQPVWCPECGRVLKGKADDRMWMRHRMCHVCVIKGETEMRITGEFEEYQNNKMRANAIAWLRDAISDLENWTRELSNPKNVLMDGRIEELDIGVAEARIELAKELEYMKVVLDEWEKKDNEVIGDMESV
jgi:hypothetical protein